MDMKTAMRAVGIEPPTDELVADGKWHRWGYNENLTYIMNDNESFLSGSFRDWRQDEWHSWKSVQYSELTEVDKRALRERQEEDVVVRQQEEADRIKRAHKRAEKDLEAGSEELARYNDYIALKGIQTHGALAYRNMLIIPMHDSNEKLCGTQHIYIDKSTGKFKKEFLKGSIAKGASFVIGKYVSTICIAEGFATAASIYESTGHMTVCSFSASNLLAVAEIFNCRYPNARIVICADNDTHGVGQKYASRAAEAVNASVVCPPAAINDFNDLHKLQGLIAVRDAIDIIPVNRLRMCAITTDIANEMRKKAIGAVYVLDGIALLGQITVIYAPPNTGKTLITISMLIDSVKAGRIKGEDVYYINEDDGHDAVLEKADMFNAYGMITTSSSVGVFKASDLESYLKNLIDIDQARGAVIVLDTLKKFTDLMDKKLSSGFMKLARRFTAAGGSMILLAHTNKRRDNDNKLVAGGTSDIIDDADCAYIIDEKKTGLGEERKTVIFENVKRRGNVLPEVCFSYSGHGKLQYAELCLSVNRHSQDEIHETLEAVTKNEEFEKDLPVIEIIREILDKCPLGKTELVKEARAAGCGNALRVRAILKKYQSVQWGITISMKNLTTFHLLGESAIAAQLKMWQ